jgi:hypothetical protein
MPLAAKPKHPSKPGRKPAAKPATKAKPKTKPRQNAKPRPKPKPKPEAKPKLKAKRGRRTRQPQNAVEAFEQALAATHFGKRSPQLLLQARRIGKLLAIQQNIEGNEFPPGVCFLHVNLPSTDSLCVRSLVEFDLDAATVIVAIHGDQELEAGHVLLPLEGIAWIGFPDVQVQVGVPFAGFHLPSQPKPLLVGGGGKKSAKASNESAPPKS